MPNFRYRWAKLDQGGWGVFVEYDQGEHAGWWRLVAEFQLEIRASDYAEYENGLLNMFENEEDPLRRGDEELPPELPDTPPSGIAALRLVERVDGISARGRWPKNLTGQRFGALTATELSERVSQGRHRHWLCRCDCGNEVEVRIDHLTNGETKSCGCESRQLAPPNVG